jgi:putative sigma-54 modulation protein
VIASEVTLRLDKSDTQENKITEIRLVIPGNDLFARKQCKTFEEATDIAVEALRRQLSRHKQKVRGR